MISLSEIKERCKSLYDDIEMLFAYTGYRDLGHITTAVFSEDVEEMTMYQALNSFLMGLDQSSIYIKQACADEYEAGVINKERDNYYFNGRNLRPGEVLQYYDDKEGYWRIGILDDDFTNGWKLVIREIPDIDITKLKVRRPQKQS